MKSKKGNAGNIALDNLERGLTMKNLTTTQKHFQYVCSFCLQNLRDGATRFDGIGACSKCNRLAHRFVDSLREHRAHYFNNLGVRK